MKFGINSYRLEHIQLKCLIKRIYENLPISARSDITKDFPPRLNYKLWTNIGLENITEKEVLFFLEIAVNHIRNIGNDNFTVDNLKDMVRYKCNFIV